jgi:hypothetical protein
VSETCIFQVGFEVLTAVSTKMAVFWVVTQCSLVEVYQRFRGPWCLHLQGDRPTRRFFPEVVYLSTLRVVPNLCPSVKQETKIIDFSVSINHEAPSGRISRRSITCIYADIRYIHLFIFISVHVISRLYLLFLFMLLFVLWFEVF